MQPMRVVIALQANECLIAATAGLTVSRGIGPGRSTVTRATALTSRACRRQRTSKPGRTGRRTTAEARDMSDEEMEEARASWARRFHWLTDEEAEQLLDQYIAADQVYFERDAESGAVRVLLGRRITRH
jgi:hypothetical protein